MATGVRCPPGLGVLPHPGGQSLAVKCVSGGLFRSGRFKHRHTRQAPPPLTRAQNNWQSPGQVCPAAKPEPRFPTVALMDPPRDPGTGPGWRRSCQGPERTHFGAGWPCGVCHHHAALPSAGTAAVPARLHSRPDGVPAWAPASGCLPCSKPGRRGVLGLP